MPDGLDQFIPRKVLFTVVLAIVNTEEVCAEASNVGNNIRS